MPRDLLIRYPGKAGASRVRMLRGGLAQLGRFTRERTAARRVVVVSDLHVSALYAQQALASLRRARVSAALVTVPNGERAKATRHLDALWSCFADLELGRDAAVVALGGGVVGDLAGFAAATWQRGIPWVGVPTSLLAQVDSSVGGKTAIDLKAGKNLVGAFHQPAGVLVDSDVLATLPLRQHRAGMAEVIKTAMATDAPLFRWIERHADSLASREPGALETMVGRSIRAKARIVRRDEHDRGGARAALNFGHTTGHAIEAACGYRRILHGEAVAIGMRVASRLSVECVRLPAAAKQRLEALLDAAGPTVKMPAVSAASLVAAMGQDKKRQADAVHWVLTPRIGRASVPRLVSRRLVRAALLEAGALA